MGKGNRNKRADLETRLQIKAQKEESAAKAKSVALRKKIITIVSIVLVVVILGGLITAGMLESNGFYLRRTVSIETENYQINNAMLSYFFNSTYSNLVSQNYYIFYYMGLNSSLSLKSQYYSNSKTMTWFDYFMNQTYSSVKDMLVHCEAARAEGIKLEDEDYAEIDESIRYIKDSAKAAGYKTELYVSNTYGAGVSIDDVRDCLELLKLYQKYYDILMDRYDARFGENEYNEYYAEHTKDMQYVDYLSYTLYVSTITKKEEEKKDDDASTAAEDGQDSSEDEENKDNYEKIRPYAEKIAQATTREEFEKAVRDYIEQVIYEGVTIVAPDSEAAKEEDAVTTDDVDKIMDTLLKEDTGYTKDNEISEWLFADDTKLLSTKIFEDEGSDSSKPDYSLTVVMPLTAPARHEYKTLDVRHILFTKSTYDTEEAAKKKAEEILAEYKNGDMTVEAFEALAETYNEDSSCLYENVAKGDMVEEFEDWLFDEERKEGDVDIVKTSYGYHIMLRGGEGRTAWMQEAHEALVSDAYESDVNTFTETYKVTYDQNKMFDINA